MSWSGNGDDSIRVRYLLKFSVSPSTCYLRCTIRTKNSNKTTNKPYETKGEEATSMAKTKGKPSELPVKKMRPALTPEARENQMISLAIDLVERRLIEGTASSQETTHFLKLASSKAQLEKERAILENELIKAKTQQLHSQERIEELYANAIKAMSRYNGHGSSEEEDEYDEY